MIKLHIYWYRTLLWLIWSEYSVWIKHTHCGLTNCQNYSTFGRESPSFEGLHPFSPYLPFSSLFPASCAQKFFSTFSSASQSKVHNFFYLNWQVSRAKGKLFSEKVETGSIDYLSFTWLKWLFKLWPKWKELSSCPSLPEGNRNPRNMTEIWRRCILHLSNHLSCSYCNCVTVLLFFILWWLWGAH